jgi:hypothetical protein
MSSIIKCKEYTQGQQNLILNHKNNEVRILDFSVLWIMKELCVTTYTLSFIFVVTVLTTNTFASAV